MRTQQQADREEQQRIKNLVLNYEAATEPEPAESMTQNSGQTSRALLTSFLDFEKRIPANQRLDKSTGNRTFRSRKLQLSDVNW